MMTKSKLEKKNLFELIIPEGAVSHGKEGLATDAWGWSGAERESFVDRKETENRKWNQAIKPQSLPPMMYFIHQGANLP